MATLRLALGTVTLLTALAGCGWYTNVPAQLQPSAVEPATVNVVFNGNNAPTFTNPTVTVVGEPGSIGANLYIAAISYTDSAGKDIPSLAEPGVQIHLRVAPSVLKSVGTSGSTPTTQEFVGGSGKAALPIVNQRVIDYAKSGDPKPGVITAKVRMTGKDDASWPSEVQFFVPVTFSGQ